jgi:hypothetical protein
LRDALEALRGALAADAGLKIIEVAKLTFSKHVKQPSLASSGSR